MYFWPGRNIDEKYEVLLLSNCMILFGTIAMYFVYSLHTSQEDYVLEIENILNINCTCTRTTSLKFEIFSIPIAGGQAELGKEEEARVDGEHYYIICISYFNFRSLSIYYK